MRLKWLRRRLANWAIKVICHDDGHAWTLDRDRQCPYSECKCSQGLFKCFRCGIPDNGEVGGHGWKSCKNCDIRPEK